MAGSSYAVTEVQSVIKTTSCDSADAWQSLPLCRHYFLAAFSSLSTQVREQGGSTGLLVHWAFGALADGQFEVMGVWPAPVSGASAWQAIHGDLTTRGVERIRFVVIPEPAGLNAAYPGATMLNSVASLLPRGGCCARVRDSGSAVDAVAMPSPAGDALAVSTAMLRTSDSHLGGGGPGTFSPWQRQVVARADESARLLQAGLGRALTRHGCFDSHEAAVSFIEQALQRLARGLVATPPASAGVLARQVAGAAAALGMRATGT